MKNLIPVRLSLIIMLVVVCLYLVPRAMSTTIPREIAQPNGDQLIDRRLIRVSANIESCIVNRLFARVLRPGSGGGQGS